MAGTDKEPMPVTPPPTRPKGQKGWPLMSRRAPTCREFRQETRRPEP